MTKKNEEPANIYKRLLGYIKPYKWRLVIAIIATQGTAIATALISVTIYIVMNGLQNKKEVVISNLPHVPFLNGFSFSVNWIPVIVIVVFTMRSGFEYLSHYQMSSIGIRAIRKVRDDLFKHIVYLSHEFYSHGRTGDFLSRIMNDVQQIQGGITDVVVDLVKQPFVILYNVVAILYFGGPYALIAIGVFPLIVIPVGLLGKSLRRTTKKMQERSADITAFIGETLAGIHIVKAFNREEREISRFEQTNKRVFDHFKKTIKVTIVQRPLIEVLGALGAGTAIWFSIQHLPLDRFTAFVGGLFLLYEPIKKLSKVNSTIQQSVASGSRIFEILDQIPSVRDTENAINFQEPFEKISFKKVTFCYEKEKVILDDLSFEVKRGEMIALVGPSGAGKSTLVHLIPRFYDPQQGDVKINGRNIKDLSLHSLRNLIGIVSQETVLFNMTVRENIAYHNPDASMEDVVRAAEAANAAKFIAALPQGYDTPLGERGMKLSGGQRQRLAIARAILKDPPILILDEATSHLDTESEREVQIALENLLKGRTSFVIAHRLSTVQKASRILVMQQGKIIQEGTSEGLLDQGGVYKRLHDLQFNL
jgi:subfamily B ATP-binding cassette protein MsbA